MLPGFIAGSLADIHPRHRRPRDAVDVELQKPSGATSVSADHHHRDGRCRRLRGLCRSGGAFARFAVRRAQVYRSGRICDGATIRSANTAASGKKILLVWLLCGAILGIACCRISALSCSRLQSLELSPAANDLHVGNFAEIFFRRASFHQEHIDIYVLAAALDIVLGAAIAFLLLRSRVPGRNLLDAIATMPLAIPGVVLAVGYLRVFHGWDFPASAPH